MVVYEVNVEIDPEILAEYQQWLPPHVTDMLKHTGFLQAEIFEVLDETTPNKKLTIFFQVNSLEDLQHYFDHHAAQMRADAIQRFGEKFRAHRRVHKPYLSLNGQHA